MPLWSGTVPRRIEVPDFVHRTQPFYCLCENRANLSTCGFISLR